MYTGVQTAGADYQASPLPPNINSRALLDLMASGNVIRVTAADFNGKSFDGSPIEPVGVKTPPEWFVEALTLGVIEIGTPGSTDYASFNVRTENDTKIWAGPGDYIIRIYRSETVFSFTVLCYDFLKAIGCSRIEDLMELGTPVTGVTDRGLRDMTRG